MFDVVAVGHILYDIRCYVDTFPTAVKLAHVKGVIKHSVGGSATNFAMNCAKLGLRSALVARIGFDEYGKKVLETVRSSGVNVDGIIFDRQRPTGTAIVLVDKGATPLVTEMVGANEPMDVSEVNPVLFRHARHVHITGTNPEAMVAAAKTASAFGRTVSFDPGRSGSAHGYKKLKPVLEHSDILFVDEHNVRNFFGLRGTDKVLLDKIKKIVGGKIVVLKRGGNPTFFTDGTNDYSLPTLKVKAIDGIGAGDAFAAGFVASVLNGKNVVEAVTFATACAALKRTREGAGGLPHGDIVREFYLRNREKLKVRQL